MRQGFAQSRDRMREAFGEVYQRSLDLIAGVCPSSDLRPLGEILGPLRARIEAERTTFVQQTRHLQPVLQGPVSGEASIGIGLNTVGMLSDRLSILAIKQQRLRSRGDDGVAKSDALFQNQTLDILTALSRARPGNSALNTKITTLPADAEASDWIGAYFGLLSTNLLLWEAQEILYLKDILSLPGEELREYIQWFAVGNMRRNRYMELCELLYWKETDSQQDEWTAPEKQACAGERSDRP